MTHEESSLMEKVKFGLLLFLPHPWFVLSRKNGISVCLPSPSPEVVVVQRSVMVKPSGRVSVAVHGKKLRPEYRCYQELSDQITPLTEETVDIFINEILCLIERFRGMEICRGAEEFQSLWKTLSDGQVDHNQFLEYRYSTAFRPAMCHRLVPSLKHKRCTVCQRARDLLHRRNKAAPEGTPKTPSKLKPFKLLTSGEKKKRHDRDQKDIRALRKRNQRLQKKVHEVLQNDGVSVDDSLANDLTTILQQNKSKMTDVQAVLIEQLIKAASTPKSLTWHPAVIRIAISLHITSPAAYEELSGILRLPSTRLLFDYTHADEHKGNRNSFSSAHPVRNENPQALESLRQFDQLEECPGLSQVRETGEVMEIKGGQAKAREFKLETRS